MAQKRERVLPRLIEEEIRESFLDYSMSVIVQRALPDARDGLKPVHRRILHAMHELSLLPDRPYKKSASVVGEVLGKYHPHGDSAVYEALVRMVQDFSLRYPLVDGQGNFGSIDGDSAAAYRYTEARLAPVALELLEEIDRETVRFSPTFDGQREEPLVLPARIPNLVVNGSSGIAVGMSTNVPPHNLREVAAAIRLLVADPECSSADLLRVLPGPDFPTGGFIVGSDGIRDMMETGRGRIVMRGRVVKEALRGGKEQLIVTELPYGTSKSRLIEQIADLHSKGKLDDVSDIRDESDRDGMRLVIELKRSADAEAVLRTLFRRTQLQSTFGAILLALDHGQPREFPLRQLLLAWTSHRIEVIQRRSRYDLEQAEVERHVAEGLLAALDRIDEVIALIRASRNRSEASERLQARLGLSDVQADAILSMRLSRLTRLEREQLEARRTELAGLIRMLREILESPERQREVLLQELDALVERFGDARRTTILEDASEDEAQIEDAVADEDAVILRTHQGFLQRMPVHLFRRRWGSGKPLAGMDRFEGDWIEEAFTARSRGWVLAFSSRGKVHFVPVLEIPEVGPSSRGQSIHALSGADRDDPIISVLAVEDLGADARVLFFSEGGQVKRTELREYGNPRAGGIIAAGVREGDRILEVRISEGTAEIVLLTAAGRGIRFPEEEIPPMGRTAQGVKGVELRGEDRVVGALLLRRDAEIATISEGGVGRRAPLSEFPVQRRGGMGTLLGPGDGDRIAGGFDVVAGDGIMLATASGQSIRAAAGDLPLQNRRGRGGAITGVDRGDRVVGVHRTLAESGARSAGSSGIPSGDPDEAVEPGGPEPTGPQGDRPDAVAVDRGGPDAGGRDAGGPDAGRPDADRPEGPGVPPRGESRIAEAQLDLLGEG